MCIISIGKRNNTLFYNIIVLFSADNNNRYTITNKILIKQTERLSSMCQLSVCYDKILLCDKTCNIIFTLHYRLLFNIKSSRWFPSASLLVIPMLSYIQSQCRTRGIRAEIIGQIPIHGCYTSLNNKKNRTWYLVAEDGNVCDEVVSIADILHPKCNYQCVFCTILGNKSLLNVKIVKSMC